MFYYQKGRKKKHTNAQILSETMNETQMKLVCFHECADKQYDNETSNNNNIIWGKKSNEMKWNEIIVLVVVVMEIVSLVNGILSLSI